MTDTHDDDLDGFFLDELDDSLLLTDDDPPTTEPEPVHVDLAKLKALKASDDDLVDDTDGDEDEDDEDEDDEDVPPAQVGWVGDDDDDDDVYAGVNTNLPVARPGGNNPAGFPLPVLGGLHHTSHAHDPNADVDDLGRKVPKNGYAVVFTEDIVAATPEEAAKIFARALRREELYVDVLDNAANTRQPVLIENPLYVAQTGEPEDVIADMIVQAGDLENVLIDDPQTLATAPEVLARLGEAIGALETLRASIEKQMHDEIVAQGGQATFGSAAYTVEPNETWGEADHQTIMLKIAETAADAGYDKIVESGSDAVRVAADMATALMYATYLAPSATPKSNALKDLGLQPSAVMERRRVGRGWNLRRVN